LADYCKEKKRWTFFLSSVPLNVSSCSFPFVTIIISFASKAVGGLRIIEMLMKTVQVPGGVASPPNAVAIF
jgi:hypothetical protein